MIYYGISSGIVVGSGEFFGSSRDGVGERDSEGIRFGTEVGITVSVG